MKQTVGPEPSQKKCALVTGGSRGIGRAIVEKLASDGYRVVFCGRDASALGIAQSEFGRKELEVHSVVADICKVEDVRRLVEQACRYSNGAGIAVLVNNAGIPGGGPFLKITDELWSRVIDTNLTSVFRITQEVLRLGGMLERGFGRIINIASTGGKQGVAMGSPYCASKHGVVGFSKSLGLELAKTGVTVNAVCPGFVETELAEHVRQGFAGVWNCTPEEAKSRIEQRIPTGRYVVPQEVAALVAYLASPMQASVTAQAINVCGGLGNY